MGETSREMTGQGGAGKPQLVSFDYDGVLVDSLERILRILTRAQADLGIGRPPCIEDLRNVANLHLRDVALNLEIPPESIPDLVDRIAEIRREDGGRPYMFPGIPQVLRQIVKDSIIAVVTFNLREEVEDVLSAYGLSDCVSLISDGTDPRPKSERIRWVLEHFAVDCRNAYMVGDARSDIREGRAAGVQTVAVAWGYQPPEILAAEDPDFMAGCPEELVAILRRGGGREDSSPAEGPGGSLRSRLGEKR